MKHNKKRKYTVFTISLLAVTALCLGVYASASTSREAKLRLAMTNNYQHAFDELVTAVGEMESALQKSVYATSPTVAGAVCTEIFGKAMTAQMSLGVLPFSTYELEQTAGFISRVGDYAFALSRSAAAGESLSDEQRENLKALADMAGVLSGNMKNLQSDMLDGVLTMDELYASERKLDAAEAEELPTVGGSMRLIEQEFPEMPSLIYDGPFSNHLSDASPRMTEGAEDIDENTGRDIASRFLRIGSTRVYPSGESNGELPCLYYQAERRSGDILTVALTKQGGRVLSMLSSHRAGEATMEIDEGLSIAADFLRTRGYRSMEESYHMLQDGVLTVNFAYSDGGVICYTDLVKVAVAMDSGEVCGFEALGYISHHGDRIIPEAKLSADEAAAKLPEGIAAENKGLALIPTAWGEEKLCYEFVCERDENHRSIIYINALSGEQEKILILLEDENGTLTL